MEELVVFSFEFFILEYSSFSSFFSTFFKCEYMLVLSQSRNFIRPVVQSVYGKCTDIYGMIF